MIIMFLGLIIVGSNCMSSELKINIFPFDKNLSVSSIKSASEYIILKHLNKNIIDIEKDGSIVGDLAIGWKISKDYKVFTFQVRENQKTGA